MINAQGGIFGSFAPMPQPNGLAAGTRLDAVYSPTTVTLAVTPASYGTIAARSWTAPIAQGLDATRPAAGAPMTAQQAAVYAPLYGLGAGQIVHALQQIAPLIYGDTQLASRSAFLAMGTAISGEMDARRGGSAPLHATTATGPGGTTLWMIGDGQFATLANASNGIPGFSLSSGGTMIGIDGAVTSSLRLGAAIGFTGQSITTPGTAGYDGHTVQASLYGSFDQGLAFVDLQGGLLMNDGTVNHTLPVYAAGLTGSVNGRGGGGSLRTGLRLPAGEWAITPSVLLSGAALQQNSLTETGATFTGLAIGAGSLASLQSMTAVQAERRVSVSSSTALRGAILAGWSYEMLDTTARTAAQFVGLPGSGFILGTASIGRSAAILGASATLETGSQLELFAGYSVATNIRMKAQNVTAGLRYAW